MDKHKKAIAHAFNKAAQTYDRHANFQRQLGHYMLESYQDKLNGHILDLGCGTGYFSDYLYKNSQILTCFDLSPKMLEKTQKRMGKKDNIHYQQGDADHLNFDKPRFKSVFSNLALQWSQDLTRPLCGLKKATQDNGNIFISTLLDGSLNELGRAWQQVDKEPHINNFLRLDEIQTCINKVGFNHSHIEVKPFVLKYTNAISLLKDLKGIGATYQPERKKHGLTTKKQLQKLEIAYQNVVGSNKLTATYQCAVMHLIP